MQRPQRGDLWLADLASADPQLSRGTTRPVLVLQSNALNNAGHPTVIVVPATPAGQAVSDGDNFPLRIRLARGGGLGHDSELLVDQVRAIDVVRLLQRLLIVPPAQVARVEQALLRLLAP